MDFIGAKLNVKKEEEMLIVCKCCFEETSKYFKSLDKNSRNNGRDHAMSIFGSYLDRGSRTSNFNNISGDGLLQGAYREEKFLEEFYREISEKYGEEVLEIFHTEVNSFINLFCLKKIKFNSKIYIQLFEKNIINATIDIKSSYY